MILSSSGKSLQGVGVTVMFFFLYAIVFRDHLMAGGKLQQAASPLLLVVKLRLLICPDCQMDIPTT